MAGFLMILPARLSGSGPRRKPLIGGSDLRFEFQLDRSGHVDAVVAFAPLDEEVVVEIWTGC